MSIARILPLSLILAASGAVLAQDDVKHSLRFTFKPGHAWHTVTVQEVTQSMNMGGQDMSTTMKMQLFSSMHLKASEGDKAHIEQKVTRVTAKMDNPMMQMEFDSSKPDSDPGMLGNLADLVGSKTSMKMATDGKVSDITIGDGVKDQAKGAGLNLEEMMKQSIVEMPAEPQPIGGTWTTKQDMPMGQMGDTQAEVTNKLISVDDKYFVIEQVIKVDTSEMELPGGMEIESMTMKGTNKLSRHTGVSHEMTMTAKMKATGQMAMTMDMTISVKPAPAQKKADAKPTTGKKDEKKVPVGAGK